MSIDLRFEKSFTINNILEKTKIKILEKDGSMWMNIGNSSCLIVSYFQSNDDIREYIDKGYNIINEDGKVHAKNGNENIQLRLDRGYENIVDGVTFYGWCNEILDEIVLTFQTRFITDEDDYIICYGEEEVNPDEIYDKTTERFGYVFNGELIIKK